MYCTNDHCLLTYIYIYIYILRAQRACAGDDGYDRDFADRVFKVEFI